MGTDGADVPRYKAYMQAYRLSDGRLGDPAAARPTGANAAVYLPAAGESLSDVAARFGLSLDTLRAVNGIGANARVPVGHALLVPTQAQCDRAAEIIGSVL